MIRQRTAPDVNDAFESVASLLQVGVFKTRMPFAPHAESAEVDERYRPLRREMFVDRAQKLRKSLTIIRIACVWNYITGSLHFARLLFTRRKLFQYIIGYSLPGRRVFARPPQERLGNEPQLNRLSAVGPVVVGKIDLGEIVFVWRLFHILPRKHDCDRVDASEFLVGK